MFTDHTLCDNRPCIAGVAVPIAFSAPCREIASGVITTDVTEIHWSAYHYHGLYWYMVLTKFPYFISNSLGFVSVKNLREAIHGLARSLHGRLFGIDKLKEYRS